MVEVYVPPAGANYSGYWDGLLVSSATSPTLLCNSDYTIEGNVCSSNGKFGLQIGSSDGVLVMGNKFRNNNTTNTAGWNGGIYLSAGAGIKDNVQIIGNAFENTGFQTSSIVRVGAQLSASTVIRSNAHFGGKLQVEGVSAIGGANLAPDRFLLVDANVITGTVPPIVADTYSATGFVRQLQDASGSAQASSGFVIQPVSRYGEKIVHMRIRTPDTMTTSTIQVQTYKAGAFVATIYNQPQALTTAWLDFICDVNSASDYNQILVTVKTDVALTGNINIEQINCWLPCE
jgi:parallel beta-helix repeat protein